MEISLAPMDVVGGVGGQAQGGDGAGVLEAQPGKEELEKKSQDSTLIICQIRLKPD